MPENMRDGAALKEIVALGPSGIIPRRGQNSAEAETQPRRLLQCGRTSIPTGVRIGAFSPKRLLPLACAHTRIKRPSLHFRKLTFWEAPMPEMFEAFLWCAALAAWLMLLFGMVHRGLWRQP